MLGSKKILDKLEAVKIHSVDAGMSVTCPECGGEIGIKYDEPGECSDCGAVYEEYQWTHGFDSNLDEELPEEVDMGFDIEQ